MVLCISIDFFLRKYHRKYKVCARKSFELYGQPHLPPPSSNNFMPPIPGNTKKERSCCCCCVSGYTDSSQYNSPSLSIAFHSPYYQQDRDASNKNTNHQNKTIFFGQLRKEFLDICHVIYKKINVKVISTQLQDMRSLN